MKIVNIKVPGKMSQKEQDLRVSFLRQLEAVPNSEKIKSCIQCGTCTGSCPVSYAMDISPREVIALFRAGDMESLLHSKTIWVCASCYACQTRCPALIKVTDIIYALKRLAMEKNIYPPHFPVYSLSQSFVKIMNSYGRLHEARLLVYYFMKTNPFKLFSFMPLGLRMAKKKRIGYMPSKIKDLKNFQKIIKKAEQFDMPRAVEEVQYLKGAVGYSAVDKKTELE
ncbi:MAG: 4Fe-4S dicluster domain-containing protein, partial [Ignavibacteriae bacterium]|nr:4Fe-4S dicluster domain-containing protein [Ignavibacteriota bacterium]